MSLVIVQNYRWLPSTQTHVYCICVGLKLLVKNQPLTSLSFVTDLIGFLLIGGNRNTAHAHTCTYSIVEHAVEAV